jgi:hypothetical protein
MVARGLAFTLTSLLAVGVLAGSAAADHRKNPRRAMANDHYYAGPKIVHGVPGLRLFFGDYALSEEEFNALYGTEKDFDESYYEPEPAPPVKRKTKPLKRAAVPKVEDSATNDNSGEDSTAAINPSRKPANKPKITQPQSENTEAATPKAAALSCDKAGSIVTGYGFSSVKAQSCKGKVYAFNATRDGKSFAVKLDAASGELTEVKKLP